jgi:hypothetical protein
VKMGFQVTGKLWNYHFGEYHLSENKLSTKGTKESSNFFGTKTDISSRAKFHFEMSDEHKNSAKVQGSIQNDVTSLHEIQLAQHLYFGESGLANTKRNFFASLNLNDDTTAWKIVLVERSDSSWIGFMTDGTRTIDLIRISEFEDGKAPSMGISAGCELKEKGETIGAVQYFGNRYNNNVIWILNSLDQKQKCLVAGAMTAIMASAHNGQESMENALDSQ